MLIIFLRALIIFVTLIVIMRLMGKRQIGEMQPFEFIITLVIAELACVPMTDVSIPLIYGIVSIVAVFILHQLLTVFEQLSPAFKKIVDGKPALVITKRGVDIKQLKKNNMDVSDLIESLRTTGNFSLDSVYYAIFESNGKLSVLEKQQKPCSDSLPVLLCSEGKLNKQNLAAANLNVEQIGVFLKSQNVKSLKEVEILTVNGDKIAYLQVKNKPYITAQIQTLKEDLW